MNDPDDFLGGGGGGVALIGISGVSSMGMGGATGVGAGGGTEASSGAGGFDGPYKSWGVIGSGIPPFFHE